MVSFVFHLSSRDFRLAPLHQSPVESLAPRIQSPDESLAPLHQSPVESLAPRLQSKPQVPGSIPMLLKIPEASQLASTASVFNSSLRARDKKSILDIMGSEHFLDPAFPSSISLFFKTGNNEHICRLEHMRLFFGNQKDFDAYFSQGFPHPIFATMLRSMVVNKKSLF